jgi:hypothetical protein
MNKYNNFTPGKRSSQQQPFPPHTPFTVVIAKPSVRTPLQEAIKKDFWPTKNHPCDFRYQDQ